MPGNAITNPVKDALGYLGQEHGVSEAITDPRRSIFTANPNDLSKLTNSPLLMPGMPGYVDPSAAGGGGANTGANANTPTNYPAPANPNGGGTPKPDKTADINQNLAGLAAVDTQTDAGTAAIDKSLGALKGGYANEAAANEKTFSNNSDTNQNNFQKNKESSYVNAAQGRQGLFGTLASLGALNGSGVDLANNAVKSGLDADLSGAGSNYATNQGGLVDSIEKFRRENDQRNSQADTQAGNAKTNLQNDAARSKQNFYHNVANDYNEMGDTANENLYSGKASALYPDIARTNVPNANLTPVAAAYTAPSLASYLAGGNTQVNTTPTTPNGPAGALPGLMVGGTKRQSSALV